MYDQKIEKIVRVNSEIEARNATEGGRAKLLDRMESLLQELLDSPEAPVAAPAGKSATVRKPNSAFAAVAVRLTRNRFRRQRKRVYRTVVADVLVARQQPQIQICVG